MSNLKPMINSKLPKVKTSIFSIMSALAAKENAINLSQGFPNFETAKPLIQLVNEAMKNGYNQYAPMPGILSLREVISEKTQNLYGAEYNPEAEITITAGATQAIFTCIASVVKTGDEVIIFTPAYDCYEPTIELFGGKTIAIPIKAPNYTINWEEVKQAISTKTKLIIINSPHNPTGAILTKKDLKKLEELVKNTNIIILSDEVYEHIIFDGEQHQSVSKFSELANRSFIISSFGKTFHTTGWKVGYVLAPDYLMNEFRKIHQFNVFCVNHPIQMALATYLKKPSHYLELPEFYQEKRDYFLDLLKDSRFEFTPSKGTYFQLLNYKNITEKSDVDFAIELTKKNKIASVPISVFYSDGYDAKMLRFCFAKTNETLKVAAEKLCAI